MGHSGVVGLLPLPEHPPGGRVRLRPWVVDDAPGLSRAVGRNIDHLRPWLPWIAQEPLDPGSRSLLIERWEDEWRHGGDLMLGMFIGGGIVGGCGLHRRTGPRGLDIGYWVDCDHTGQGIATGAARQLTGTALRIPDVDFVEIRHDRANRASGRIPERIGYRHVGDRPDVVRAPGETGVRSVWRMEAADWPGPNVP